MSVNERASLETTMASFPISFWPIPGRPATAPSPERAHPHRGASSPSRAHAARAADDHDLFILVPFHVYSPCEV